MYSNTGNYENEAREKMNAAENSKRGKRCNSTLYKRKKYNEENPGGYGEHDAIRINGIIIARESVYDIERYAAFIR